jgi:hypothetical protein
MAHDDYFMMRLLPSPSSYSGRGASCLRMADKKYCSSNRHYSSTLSRRVALVRLCAIFNLTVPAVRTKLYPGLKNYFEVLTKANCVRMLVNHQQITFAYILNIHDDFCELEIAQ